MSKLDIGVGDEFPLDEPHNDGGRERHGRHRPEHRHERHHHHHHGHHHRGHHHGRHGISRLALLLVIAGVVALIVERRLTTDMAYGMIGLGAGLLVLMFLVHAIRHWRHHRSNPSQAA